MYLEFYNLKEKPFELTPSTKYLYLGEIHKEALALLTYGVLERMGFILLTGEVGTGKTTMVHTLINNLGEDVRLVYLSNPLLSVNDFMDYLAWSVFKKKINFRSKADFLILFEAFLKKQFQNQKNFILIIDEAQKLSFELLEEIRLLSNMESGGQKLINIFLVGQPELNDTLSRPECRPLLQRISIRYHIKALDPKGTRDYIYNRLKMAGAADGSRIFSERTVKAIHKYSMGYPRMINILADNALLLGYAREVKKLTPEMVKECYDDLQLTGSLFGMAEKVKPPAIEEKKQEDRKPPRKWPYSLFLLLLVIALLAGVYGKEYYQRYIVPILNLESSVNEEITIKKETSHITPDPSETLKTPDPDSLKPAVIEEEETADQRNEEVDAADNDRESAFDQKVTSETASPLRVSIPESPWKTTRIVNEGDTLARMAIDIYGQVNDQLLNLIKDNNPGIKDINLISTGQIIRFPYVSGIKSDLMYTVHIASFNRFENAREMFEDLVKRGYEVYIMPLYNERMETIFRVTLGNFEDKQKAEAGAKQVIDDGIANYAYVFQLEMR